MEDKKQVPPQTEMALKHEELAEMVIEGKKCREEGLDGLNSFMVKRYYKDPEVRRVTLEDIDYDIVIPYALSNQTKKSGPKFTAPKKKNCKRGKTYGKRKNKRRKK